MKIRQKQSRLGGGGKWSTRTYVQTINSFLELGNLEFFSSNGPQPKMNKGEKIDKNLREE